GWTPGRPSPPRPATGSPASPRWATTSASNTRPEIPRERFRFAVPLGSGQNRHRDETHEVPRLTRLTPVEAVVPPEQFVARVAQARIPTAYGDFTAHVYESRPDGTEHVAFVRGDLDGDLSDLSDRSLLVRVHSECLTGD